MTPIFDRQILIKGIELRFCLITVKHYFSKILRAQNIYIDDTIRKTNHLKQSTSDVMVYIYFVFIWKPIIDYL